MAEITATLVKELREKTGAGMMDCKKALDETAATSKRPSTGCARRASRGRQEGRPHRRRRPGRRAVDGTRAPSSRSMPRPISSRRNEQFQDFVARCAEAGPRRRRRPAKVAGGAVSRHRPRRAGRADRLIATIGENMKLRRAGIALASPRRRRRLRPQRGRARHRQDRRPRGLELTGDKAKLAALGKQIAMHIAAANPLSLPRRHRPGHRRARARHPDRAGQGTASPKRSSTRWSKAACASSTKNSRCSRRPS